MTYINFPDKYQSKTQFKNNLNSYFGALLLGFNKNVKVNILSKYIQLCMRI